MDAPWAPALQYSQDGVIRGGRRRGTRFASGKVDQTQRGAIHSAEDLHMHASNSAILHGTPIAAAFAFTARIIVRA